MKKNGFTLLEILVVISIIGILVALGTTAFSTAQRKSRDARRKADVKAIQNGFEQYYSRENTYPTTLTEANDITIFPAGLPEDPKLFVGHPDYYMTLSADAFCVCSLLESTAGNAVAFPNVGDTSCSYGSGDYYCLSNLQ